MLSNKAVIWVATALSCLLIVSWPPSVADAATGQDRPTTDARGQGGPSQPGKAVPPVKAGPGCEQLYTAALHKIDQYSKLTVLLQLKINSLNQEVSALEQKATLPACVNKVVWTHPTIPPVDCAPFVCAASPYSCKKVCTSNLDCAPGFACSSASRCLKY